MSAIPRLSSLRLSSAPVVFVARPAAAGSSRLPIANKYQPAWAKLTAGDREITSSVAKKMTPSVVVAAAAKTLADRRIADRKARVTSKRPAAVKPVKKTPAAPLVSCLKSSTSAFRPMQTRFAEGDVTEVREFERWIMEAYGECPERLDLSDREEEELEVYKQEMDLACPVARSQELRANEEKDELDAVYDKMMATKFDDESDDE